MAAKSYKIGESIPDQKFGVENKLSIDVYDLPPPPLKKGDKGEGVTELQNALVKLERLAKSFVTGTYDEPTARAIAKFQMQWEITGVTGYEKVTRLAMAHALNGEKPNAPAGPSGGAGLVPPPKTTTHAPPKTTTAPPKKKSDEIRAEIVKWANWMLEHKTQVEYQEVRPIPQLKAPFKHALPFITDCSGSVTMCYAWSGAPDPNGENYDGQGYTGSLVQHMRHISGSQAKIGDLVVFGTVTGDEHVCLLLQPDINGPTALFSHGGPDLHDPPHLQDLAGEIAYRRESGKSGGAQWLTVFED